MSEDHQPFMDSVVGVPGEYLLISSSLMIDALIKAAAESRASVQWVAPVMTAGNPQTVQSLVAVLEVSEVLSSGSSPRPIQQIQHLQQGYNAPLRLAELPGLVSRPR